MDINSNFDLRKFRDLLLTENLEQSPLQEMEVERLGIFGDIDNDVINGDWDSKDDIIDYLNSIIDYCNKEIQSVQLSNPDDLEENSSLEEMAKLTGKEGVLTPLGQKAAEIIKSDPEIAQILNDTEEELYQNQTNQFASLVRGSRELGQRGRKADPNKPAAEPKAKAEKPAKEKSPKLKITNPTADEKPVSSTFIDGEDEEEMEMDKQAAKAAKGSKEFADEVAPDKTEKFNLGLKFVTKYKDDRNLIDAYLKKAKDEYKLSANMIKDLKRAAGRQVEA